MLSFDNLKKKRLTRDRLVKNKIIKRKEILITLKSSKYRR